MEIRLTGKSNIYEQITEEYARFIRLGALRAGEKLPSVRELAMRLGVNPNTVDRAYGELEKRGLIMTIPKKGAFVRGESSDERFDEAVRQLSVLKGAGLSESDALRAALRSRQRLQRDSLLLSGACGERRKVKAARSAGDGEVFPAVDRQQNVFNRHFSGVLKAEFEVKAAACVNALPSVGKLVNDDVRCGRFHRLSPGRTRRGGGGRNGETIGGISLRHGAAGVVGVFEFGLD